MLQTDLLSEREKEVVDLLLQGKSNKQVASVLGISEKTVEFHLKNIYAKLHVSTRTEAILKLGKSTGNSFTPKLGESIVDKIGEKADNEGKFIYQLQEASSVTPKIRLREFGKLLGKSKAPIIIGAVLVLILAYIFSFQTTTWKKYERECEYPDDQTSGQTIGRSHASGSNVHGQFGTSAAPPWSAQPGFVIYKNISTPQIDQLYLKLRYSKNSSSSASILIYIDDEAAPRAAIYPEDQGDWNQFAWTEPIFLGSIESGAHSIKFITVGQQYGVVDLDRFVLTGESP